MKIEIYGSRENMHQRSLTVVHIISRTLYLTVVERYFTRSGFKLLQKKVQSPRGHIPHILDIHKTLFTFSGFINSWPDKVSHMEMLGYYPSYLNQLQEG